MPRLLALLTLALFLPLTLAADPTPIEKQLALQKAMATARQYLDVNMSVDAVAVLEAEIPNADGNKAFLTLLREAYLADTYRLEKATTPDPARLAQLRRNISLLGGVVPVATPAPVPVPASVPAPAPVLPATPQNRPENAPLPPPSFDPPTPTPAPDLLVEAAAAFKKADYVQAERLFAASGTAKLTAEQKVAWAYCRIKLAADRVNAPACDAATAAAAEKDAIESLKLAPEHAELQKIGQQVIATANLRATGRREPIGAVPADVVETASFRVRCSGNRERGDAVAKAAEINRKEIFERWSGPPAGAWEPKCEIFIHSTAEAYVQATGRPVGSTGNASVRLVNGRAAERRIDLRADDTAIASNTLPRELTHVVLADLFPDSPPPKWAEEGMAVLAGTPEEVGRYTRTLRRCARDGEWFGLGQLMELKDFPTAKITGFYCESVSLTDYLIRLGGGERNFTIFLRDCHRYGTPQALKRQYGIDGPQALEAAWKRSALDVARGQGP